MRKYSFPSYKCRNIRPLIRQFFVKFNFYTRWNLKIIGIEIRIFFQVQCALRGHGEWLHYKSIFLVSSDGCFERTVSGCEILFPLQQSSTETVVTL